MAFHQSAFGSCGDFAGVVDRYGFVPETWEEARGLYVCLSVDAEVDEEADEDFDEDEVDDLLERAKLATLAAQVAVANFNDDELGLEIEGNRLHIWGECNPHDSDEGPYRFTMTYHVPLDVSIEDQVIEFIRVYELRDSLNDNNEFLLNDLCAKRGYDLEW